MIGLDTDHLSVLERSDQPGSGALRARLAQLPPSEVVTTIISYEEQMRGWMAYLARTRSVAQQVEAYRRLLQHLDNYRRIPVLPFDEAAAVAFQQLRRARLRIGTMDLKIAAIVVPVMRPCSRDISQTFVRSPACKSRTGPRDGRRMSSTGHLDVLISAFGRYQQYFCGAQASPASWDANRRPVHRPRTAVCG
jgi:tRNA(fMet)-specific endonuclease VapC